MTQGNLHNLEKTIGVQFDNRNLLLNAFVHRSYLNEHPQFNLPSNERLEFLGDACLELVVSEFLFKQFPNRPEGDLTNFRSALVNTVSLAETARRLNLGKYLLLSKGEEDSGGRDSEYLLANTFEALLGAVYLERGYAAAQGVIQRLLIPKLENILKDHTYKDAKSKFQEITQATIAATPVYKVISQSGPDHDKIFCVGVFLNNQQYGIGEGSSKQRAELAAAQNALEKWEKNGRITVEI